VSDDVATDDSAAAAITATSVPVRSAAAFVVELDGEAVVLDEAANRLHLLNRTATLVWNCLDGDVDVSGLAQEIADVIELPYERVFEETIAVVRDLGSQGLLEGFASVDEQ
jgi:hypothetical protein